MNQNKKASMLPTSEGISTVGLKMVKNASIFQEHGVYFIRHYSTIIFAYNPQNKLCEANWHCSVTSDRQIRSAIQFFSIARGSISELDAQIDLCCELNYLEPSTVSRLTSTLDTVDALLNGLIKYRRNTGVRANG